MIRRDAVPTESVAPAWILISQIEHARLASQLAEPWSAPGFAPLVPRGELLWVILHHDDGWQRWEECPGVDPLSGRPRSFTEMELEDSLEIWAASIQVAERAGYLQAYLVAGHFTALAGWVGNREDRQGDRTRAEQFINHYGRLMTTWLAAWIGENPAANTPTIAARALAQLQFFDRLSLWFCCAARTEPETFETPDGSPLTLTPQDPSRLVLTSWPFDVPVVNIEIPARRVPVNRYSSREVLAAAPAQSIRLGWQLQPSAEKFD